jgi:hypothetical protein
LESIGLLTKVSSSEWAAPIFVVPKKDQTVRVITDFRGLNKSLKRKPYPTPQRIREISLCNNDRFEHGLLLHGIK